MKYYAGIGSRNTPPEILKQMTELATTLEANGYTLRSGGADGADSAFSDGCTRKETYIPWLGFGSVSPTDNNTSLRIHNLQQKHYDLASTLHPAWERCSQGARKLHARNTQQILGENLDNPVDFVICWTPKGEMVGGTATAMRLAKDRGITVFNLALEGDVVKLKDYIQSRSVLEKLEN